MALFLSFHTLWPQNEGDVRKYDIKDLKPKEWRQHNEKLSEAICDTKYKQLKTNTSVSDKGKDRYHPESIYRRLMATINKTFKKAIKKNKKLTYTNNTANFIKQNKEHELMGEFLKARKAGHLEECMSIQKTINRDRWRGFLSTSKARDLRKVF